MTFALTKIGSTAAATVMFLNKRLLIFDGSNATCYVKTKRQFKVPICGDLYFTAKKMKIGSHKLTGI